jgi:hypothetical protein
VALFHAIDHAAGGRDLDVAVNCSCVEIRIAQGGAADAQNAQAISNAERFLGMIKPNGSSTASSIVNRTILRSLTEISACLRNAASGDQKGT